MTMKITMVRLSNDDDMIENYFTVIPYHVIVVSLHHRSIAQLCHRTIASSQRCGISIVLSHYRHRAIYQNVDGVIIDKTV